jgi:hypothetical protein
MIEILHELAGVVREAIKDWGAVLRFCVVVAAVAVLAVIIQLI